jgi:hypothetical protein
VTPVPFQTIFFSSAYEMTWSISIKRVGTGDTSTSSASKVIVASPTLTSDGHVQQQSLVPASNCDSSYLQDDATSPEAARVRDDDQPGAPRVKSFQEDHQPSNFIVQVNPNSPLSELHSSIEAVTGLKAHQQRLIYRGRILPGQSSDLQQPAAVLPGQSAPTTDSDSSMRICDVTGLNDGHTIHLFPRKSHTDQVDPVANAAEPAAVESSINNSATSSLQEDSASATATSLLSALFGMRAGLALSNSGNVTVISSSANNNGGNSSDSLPEALANLAGLASQAAQRRRNAHIAATRGNEAEGVTTQYREARRAMAAGRRGASASLASRRQRGYRDGVPPVREPGSLETIRQSLLTLHTMLGAAGTSRQELDGKPNRTFFKGQWVDVKDTVNQWLEATVIDVVTPEEVLGVDFHLLTDPLGMDENISHLPAPSTVPRGSMDGFPVISMDDLEGRRSLLLQTVIVPNGSGEGARTIEIPRDAFASKQQLLLIHYNGWPHRWDEWIRSDSPRIRTFRSRTRHSSSLPFSAPSIHSVHDGSPHTHILSSDNEQVERAAVLPEVGRILSDVQSYLNSVTTSTNCHGSKQYMEESQASNSEEEKEAIDDDDIYCNSAASNFHPRPNLPWQNNGFNNAKPSASNSTEETTPHDVSRSDVQILAALFDRLGRTLIDLAPHVVSLATTFPDHTTSGVAEEEGSRKFPTSYTTANLDQSSTSSPQIPASPVLFHPGVAASVTPEQQRDENIDYVSGLVHTRVATSSSSTYITGVNSDSVRSGRDRAAAIAAFLENTGTSDYSSSSAGAGDAPEDNEETNTNSDSSSFPESLARLIAGGGSDGGGIDIHIHAVVTPGFLPGGGLLFGGLTGADVGTASTTDVTTLSPVSEVAAPPSTAHIQNDEDMGLFDELYGEPLELPVSDPSLMSQQTNLNEETPSLLHSDSQDDGHSSTLSANVNEFSGAVNVNETDTPEQIFDREALSRTIDAALEVAPTSTPHYVSPSVDPEFPAEERVGEPSNSSPNDTAQRIADDETDVASSVNNESGRERRDLLSVIRRYTLGRGT